MKTKPFSVFNVALLLSMFDAPIFDTLKYKLFYNIMRSGGGGHPSFRSLVFSLHVWVILIGLTLTGIAIELQLHWDGLFDQKNNLALCSIVFVTPIIVTILALRDVHALQKYVNVFNALHVPGEEMSETFKRMLEFNSGHEPLTLFLDCHLKVLGRQVCAAQKTEGKEKKAILLRKHFVSAHKAFKPLFAPMMPGSYDEYMK